MLQSGCSVDEWKDFSPNLKADKMVLIPLWGDPAYEKMIKHKTQEEGADAEEGDSSKMPGELPQFRLPNGRQEGGAQDPFWSKLPVASSSCFR